MSTDRNELIAAAARAHAAGNLDEAERIARKVLLAESSNSDALLILGIVAVKRNNPVKAEELIRQALDLAPNSFDGAFWLSAALRRQGRHPEAVATGQRAVHLNPKSEHALNQLGMCFLDVGQCEYAVGCFLKAIEIDPKVGPFYDNLGRAFLAWGRNGEAIGAFERALAIGPVQPGILFRLGDAYMSEPNPAGAGKCATAILQRDPNSAPGNLLLARALIADGQVAEAAQYARKAMELAPNNAIPVAYYGRALQSLGQIAEAEEQFKRSIELEPRQGFAYHALVHNHKVTQAERPLVDKMAELARDGGLPGRETVQLEYGLGKALEDLGEYEAAMSHFDAANRIDHELKVGVAPFSPEQLHETANFLIETFSKALIERNQVGASESEVPIFVVGMMRSGTTLAEQILSSHPLIGGVGEQLFWPENAGTSEKVFLAAGAGTPLTLDLRRISSLAVEYLALLEKLAPGNSRIVDKMNTNYLLLGLLHLAFPNARIIHMVRHPVDTCISIWATPVANGIDLCADKSNLVFAYREYLRVMDHWLKVIPSDRLLSVQYEKLVSDQEGLTREMIAFCGMSWDDACLKPQDNIRSVKTPSVWQVRQPVYRTSMQRWRKYATCLGAFGDLLESSER